MSVCLCECACVSELVSVCVRVCVYAYVMFVGTCPRFEACRISQLQVCMGEDAGSTLLAIYIFHFIFLIVIEYNLLPPPPPTHTHHTHSAGASGRTTFMMRTARSTLWACGSLLRTSLPLQRRR